MIGGTNINTGRVIICAMNMSMCSARNTIRRRHGGILLRQLLQDRAERQDRRQLLQDRAERQDRTPITGLKGISGLNQRTGIVKVGSLYAGAFTAGLMGMIQRDGMLISSIRLYVQSRLGGIVLRGRSKVSVLR